MVGRCSQRKPGPSDGFVGHGGLFAEQDHGATAIEDLHETVTAVVEQAAMEPVGHDDAVILRQVGGGQLGQVHVAGDVRGEPLVVQGSVVAAVPL